MIQSHVVEVDGVFVGAAITTATGVRFRAVHMMVEELDESVWRSPDDLHAAVRHLFKTGRLSGIRSPVEADPVQSAANPFMRASSTRATSRME